MFVLMNLRMSIKAEEITGVEVLKKKKVRMLKLRTFEKADTNVQIEPCHVKTCLRGLRPGKTKTSLFSYKDLLEV